MPELPQINKDQLVLAKKGDLKAISLIITTFEKAIFNHLYRLVGNKEDAADLTQDTFFKVYKKRNLIDPEQNFKAWLYKIATNTAYDWFDQKKGKISMSLDEEGALETIEQNLPYYRIDRAEKIDLERALLRIKPQYQTVIFLFYQQGFSYDEIGNILNVPINSVKTLLYRAKKSLSEELQ
jgi:RNA polymerase sigma-70 factor (ECF subfamily)